MGGPSITNPHDKFFRATMAHKRVAVDFFKSYLPEKVQQALNVDSLMLMQHSYISNELQESLSDLVFSCELADKPAYLTLLVEHQSCADKMMPFRVHHYLFGVLHNYLKQHPGSLLPAVYTLVFYHGQATPYPYSLSLWDCFDDPLGLMPQVLYNALPLIDVNQLSDQELKQQQWVGPMALALKHSRQQDVASYALDILGALPWKMEEPEAVELLQLLLNYLLSSGNIDDVNAFVEASTERLSGRVRSEVMTFAEKLEEQGIVKGRQEGRKEAFQEASEKFALRLLKERIETKFIVKMTDLSLADIECLRARLVNS